MLGGKQNPITLVVSYGLVKSTLTVPKGLSHVASLAILSFLAQSITIFPLCFLGHFDTQIPD